MTATAPPVWVLTGPTGVGKTALALELAERLGTEIISADSRQVFRGLDIGTAKPTPNELSRVRHHWIDELDVGEPTSGGLFARAADRVIDRLHDEGRPALVVGGSTLYVEAVVRGLASLPDVPPEVAAEANQEVETAEGRQRLFDELQHADPTAAATLDVSKSQRLARLVGLLRASGQRPSDLWNAGQTDRRPVRLVVLDRPRDELYRRIDTRVEQMVADGLLDENRRLLAAGHRLDTNPLRTIGYQEPIRFLEGEIDEAEMVRLLKQNSRQYAKRQLTWFRRYPEAWWVSPFDLSVEKVLEMQ